MLIIRIAGRIAAVGAVLLGVLGFFRTWQADEPPRHTPVDPGLLHGRITAVDGTTYQGRLRFGGTEEAFWGDYFNGVRDGNPWLTHLPSERLPAERRDIELFGWTIWRHERPLDLRRPFMVRFGDIAKLEAKGRDLTVTLRSGRVVELDRYSADDFADGVRVWDERYGVVDLNERKVRTIEFTAPARPRVASSERLHGTVRTRQGDFTGFLQWDRNAAVGEDVLEGRTADGELRGLPFRGLLSIARRSPTSAVATLLDGEEIVLSGTRQVGDGHRGIYVDDERYGRVLVSWGAFDRVDFSAVDERPSMSGPAYGDFPAGRRLAGVVTTRSGERLAGLLVYDLDESEFVETLDAPYLGVDYTIPFGLVASIVLDGGGAGTADRARVALRGGELLELERSGDLGDGNAGMLVFPGDGERGEYVPWAEVRRIDFARPGENHPAYGMR